MKKKFRKPPLPAKFLLRHLTEYQERYSVAGDMEEAYYEIYEDHGYFRAVMWFWYQSLYCARKYIGYVYNRSKAMLKNYFKIALRNIIRHKGYSIINITGLAVGIACCMTILLWVQDELSFDKFHENYDNIYRIGADIPGYGFFEISPAPLGPAIIKDVPEVINIVRFCPHTRKVFKYGDKAFYESGGVIADPAIFSVFTFPFKEGNPDGAFSDPFNIVITEEFGEKYFDDESPLGKIMEVDGIQVTVTGVIENIPNNSHLNFDYMSSFEFIRRLSGYGTSWGSFNFITYAHLLPNADVPTVNDKMLEVAKTNNCSQVIRGNWGISLQKLSDAYLNGHISHGTGQVGNSNIVYAFSIIAVFILLIACVNFMNLSTARSSDRAREVGMRKTVGALRSQIIRQFFGESFIIVVIASIISFILIIFALPFFNDLAGKELSLDFLNITHMMGIIAIVLITGLLSGCYPALFLSRFMPVNAMKGTGSKGGKGQVFRKFLVVFQFSFTIILVIGTVVIYQQLNYIKDKDLGFNKENLVHIPIKENIGEKFDVFKAEIQKDPSIISVGAEAYLSATLLNRTTNYDWDGRPSDYRVDMFLNYIDYDFLSTMDIEVVQGRNFSREYVTDSESAYILNEEAIRQMNIQSPIGKRFSANGINGTIVGVVKDVHIKSLHEKIHPLVCMVLDDYTSVAAYGAAIIRLNGERTSEALGTIERVWNEVNPVSPFEYSFLGQTYNTLYAGEQKLGTIINTFTFIAVLISILGLFGLSSYIIEQRTKEVGIRKVLGSSVSGLLIHLNKDFIKWVLLANIFAWPAGYFIMEKFLEQYAYRTAFGVGTYLFSGLLALIIAVVTVSFQSAKSANANPVDSLRYE